MAANSNNSGVLIVDKPENLTSFSVDFYIKKVLDCKKVGHAGTIDPFATGVLPVLINNATKFQDPLVDIPKSYEGSFKFGIFTDTLDICGKILKERDVSSGDIENVAKYLEKLKGEFFQKFPIFSAKKFKGVPYYKYARKNVLPMPENKGSVVNIYDFKIISVAVPFINFMCKVSKGTYVRAFVQDIMDKFDIPVHLFGLRRTSAGGFNISEAVSFKELEKGKDFILTKIMPVELIYRHLKEAKEARYNE